MAKFLSKLWSDIKEFHEALIIILVPLLMLPLPAVYNFENGVANFTYVLVIINTLACKIWIDMGNYKIRARRISSCSEIAWPN